MSLNSIDGIKYLTWRNVKMFYSGSDICWLQSADDYFHLNINTTNLTHMFICEATKRTKTQSFKAFY